MQSESGWRAAAPWSASGTRLDFCRLQSRCCSLTTGYKEQCAHAARDECSRARGAVRAARYGATAGSGGIRHALVASRTGRDHDSLWLEISPDVLIHSHIACSCLDCTPNLRTTRRGSLVSSCARHIQCRCSGRSLLLLPKAWAATSINKQIHGAFDCLASSPGSGTSHLLLLHLGPLASMLQSARSASCHACPWDASGHFNGHVREARLGFAAENISLKWWLQDRHESVC